jgi:hypothetical protein
VGEPSYGLELILSKVLLNGQGAPHVWSATRAVSKEEDEDELFMLTSMLRAVFVRPDEAYAALLAANLILSKEFYEERYQEFLLDEQKGNSRG